MVFVLLLDSTIPEPLSYHWGHDMYEACPSCARAHERRTCDGETEVTFEFCAKHVEKATKDPSLDHFMLNEVRRLIHPLISPVPTYPVTAAGLMVTSKDDLKKKVKLIHGHGKATPGNPNLVMGIPGVQMRRDEALNTFDKPIKATYAHAKGCIHSDEPDVVLKSKAALNAMDQFARERLANINALLKAGVDYELGPGPECDIDTVKTRQDRKGEGSCISGEESNSSAASVASTLSDYGTASGADSSSEAAAHLVLLDSESEARSLLRAERTRLEQCLATSSLAKGMYFKRCNGQWVSALDDILPYGKGREMTAKVRHEVTREAIRPKVGENMLLKGLKTRMWLEDGEEKVQIKSEFVFNLEDLGPPPDLEGHHIVDLKNESALKVISSLISRETQTSASSATSRNATSGTITSVSVEGALRYLCRDRTTFDHAMKVLRARQPPLSDSLPETPESCIITSMSSLEKALEMSAPPIHATSIDAMLAIDDSTKAYGYALLSASDVPIPPTLLTPEKWASCPDAASLPTVEHRIDRGISTTWSYSGNGPENLPGFRFLANILAAREGLVRSGQCTPEELKVTSWGYNRLVKKQLVKQAEDEVKLRKEKGGKRKGDKVDDLVGDVVGERGQMMTD